MTASERGFLLLFTDLGDGLPPLSLYRLNQLRLRMHLEIPAADPNEPVRAELLERLGYSTAVAQKMEQLLSREEALDTYLALGEEKDCHFLTCVSEDYPQSLRTRLRERAPAVLFYRGNLTLLQNKAVALVGSRQLDESGRRFAERVGQLAAAEGYILVSGNAKGADRTAQEACLAAGGSVISVLSDALCEREPASERVLYLAESGWHLPFSAPRALSRNRLIHGLAEHSFVARCEPGSGTWQGTEEALRRAVTQVTANDDGSDCAKALAERGARLCKLSDLRTLRASAEAQLSVF